MMLRYHPGEALFKELDVRLDERDAAGVREIG
jgi:hypothetical protein